MDMGRAQIPAHLMQIPLPNTQSLLKTQENIISLQEMV